MLLPTELGEWGRVADDVLLYAYTTVPWTGDEGLAKVKCGGDRNINTRSSLPARGGAVCVLGRLFSLLCNLGILCFGPGSFIHTLGHLRAHALRDCSLQLVTSLCRGLALLIEFPLRMLSLIAFSLRAGALVLVKASIASRAASKFAALVLFVFLASPELRAPSSSILK
jgi:hypothetical protein